MFVGGRAQRSIGVARVLTEVAKIPPYRLVIAGRGGQNPNMESPDGSTDERVEIILEYYKPVDMGRKVVE